MGVLICPPPPSPGNQKATSLKETYPEQPEFQLAQQAGISVCPPPYPPRQPVLLLPPSTTYGRQEGVVCGWMQSGGRTARWLAAVVAAYKCPPPPSWEAAAAWSGVAWQGMGECTGRDPEQGGSRPSPHPQSIILDRQFASLIKTATAGRNSIHWYSLSKWDR